MTETPAIERPPGRRLIEAEIDAYRAALEPLVGQLLTPELGARVADAIQQIDLRLGADAAEPAAEKRR